MAEKASFDCPSGQEKPIDDVKAKRRTMSLAIVEGSFGIGSNTVADNFFVPFALAIGSTPFQVGILTALPGLVNPIGQVTGSHLMYSKTRGGIIKNGIFGMSLSWIVVLVMAIVAMQGDSTWGFLSWFMLAFYSMYTVFGGLMSPSWVSNMGDIVPPDHRGRYFSKRNLINTLTSMILAMALSFWLQDYKNRATELAGADAERMLMLGFVALFALGTGTRFISWLLFQFHYYPPLTITKENKVSLIQFLKELPRTNFGQFTILVSLITFGQWIGGSFFNIYMLKPVAEGGLGFDYVMFVLMGVVNSVVAIIAFPFLGKFGDKYGNVRLMRLGAIIIPTLPLMWVFFNTPLGIALFPQMWGGIGWTAFNLATSNFIYDNVPAQKRGAYVAFYTLIVGIGQLAGGLLGSTLVVLFPPAMLGSGSYLLLFLISGIVRAIFVAIYLPRIKEVNSKAKPIFGNRASAIYKVVHDVVLGNGKRTNGNQHPSDEPSKNPASVAPKDCP